MPACEYFLGQLGRVLMFSLLAGGCVCAFLAATSCEFFSYTDSLEAASLPPPFVNQTFGRVGIFGYIIDEANDDECTTYSETLMEAMGTFNTYWMTAQFSAIVGPSAAALAWLLNLIEWFFWSHTCTYTLVVVLLLVAFSAQGLTFMIYGQREFCFDDQVAGDCQIEFGAYMAIAATAAFYSAAIVWCCMPRNPPFCVGQPPPKANKGEDDENEFYGAHTRAMLQDDEDADYNNYGNTAPKELEPSSVYDQGASENVGWADSNNRGGIPQRSADDKDYYKHNSNPPPMAPVVESPPAEWDTPPSHDRSIDWIANNNNGDLLASSSQDPAGDDFDNPFLLDDSNLPPEDPAHRPAYGNLQG